MNNKATKNFYGEQLEISYPDFLNPPYPVNQDNELHQAIPIPSNKSDRILELNLELQLVQEKQNLLQKTHNIVEQYGTEILQLMLGHWDALKSPESEIIFGSSGGRSLLIQTLEQAKKRVIIACPWLRRQSITDEVILKIRAILDQGVRVDIGWGYHHDIGKVIKLDSHNNYYIDAPGKIWENYNALPKLRELEQRYPHFHLKLLGTHGKYWICDHKFAYVGSYNVLSATLPRLDSNYPDLAGDEVGTLHRSPHNIQLLIQRFDHRLDLTKASELEQVN